MLLFFYNLFAYSYTLFYFLYLILTGKKEEAVQRLGYIEEDKEEKILIHAASVGEVMGLLYFFNKFFDKLSLSITLSIMRGYAKKICTEILKDKKKIKIIYAPYDIPFAIKNIINRIRPKLLVIVETELWPNLISTFYQHKIKVILINGRISNKSYNKYLLFSFFFRKILNKIELFSMQTQKDKDRIKNIGAEEKKVKIGGLMKLDTIKNNTNKNIHQFFLSIRKLNKFVITVASIRPKEEYIASAICKNLYNNKDMIFILAPRYIDAKRLKKLENLLKKNNLKYIKRSNLDNNFNFNLNSVKIILLDTIGELVSIYRISDIVVVCGSFIDAGCHNLIEPLSSGKVVIFGKYISNYEGVAALAKEYNCGFQVKNIDELIKKIIFFYNNPDELKRKGAIALQMIKENTGATEKNIELINELLKN